MYVDAQNEYSDAQAITATAVSTNALDHSENRDLGVGEDIWLVVSVAVAMTDAGSDSTVTVTIETDDTDAFGSALITRTLTVFAALSAVGEIRIARLGPDDINETVSRLRYTVANGDLTTGSFDGFLTKDIQRYIAYADNITITVN